MPGGLDHWVFQEIVRCIPGCPGRVGSPIVFSVILRAKFLLSQTREESDAICSSCVVSRFEVSRLDAVCCEAAGYSCSIGESPFRLSHMPVSYSFVSTGLNVGLGVPSGASKSRLSRRGLPLCSLPMCIFDKLFGCSAFLCRTVWLFAAVETENHTASSSGTSSTRPWAFSSKLFSR